MQERTQTDADTIRNLLERLRAAENEKHFGQELLNLLPLPVFYEDSEGRYLGCNQAFCDFMGKSREEIISKTVFEINASPAAHSYFERDLQMIASRLSCEVLERVMLRGDGEHRNVVIYKSLLTRLGEVNGLVGVLLDVTELQEARSREEFYREKLVSLASAFAVSKEQERCLIAREIHDTISQNLALSKLKLRLLQENAEDEGLRSGIGEVVATVDEAIRYTRTLTFELGVPVLYQLGLDAALQWLVDELKRKHGFTVRYRAVDLTRDMDDNLRAFLFRSAQELLMNAVKHSGVSEAALTVERKNRHIVVTVEDRGKGFDAYALSWSDFSSKSYGLFSLETIVRSLGGEVHIRSERGAGTTVTLRLPFAAPPPPDDATVPPPSDRGHFE